jgi:drug/metabolite transporter (DMT)-like permease
MRLLGWSKAFEERRTYQNILGKVRNTEVAYWYWLLMSILTAFVGLAVMLSAPEGNLKQMLLGLFIAIDGAIAWAVVKIVVHVRLAMYWILWDSQNRKDESHIGS